MHLKLKQGKDVCVAPPMYTKYNVGMERATHPSIYLFTWNLHTNLKPSTPSYSTWNKNGYRESVYSSMFWLFLLGDERLVCGLDPVLNLLRPFPTFKYNYSMSAH